jgi:hypothetical protein
VERDVLRDGQGVVVEGAAELGMDRRLPLAFEHPSENGRSSKQWDQGRCNETTLEDEAERAARFHSGQGEERQAAEARVT